VNPPAASTEPRYVTCFCRHCKGGIEFDANHLRPDEKRVVQCPHCQSETILELPAEIAAARTPVIELPAPKLEAAPAPPQSKLENIQPPVAVQPTKPEVVKIAAEPVPAKIDEWRVELPLGGRDGYIGYHEGDRVAPFYCEVGGGVVMAIIHIGAPTDWNRLYPWAANRRTEILQRLIAEVIRQRELKCKADIDEKSGHIFFREIEAVKPTLEIAPVQISEPPKILAVEPPQPSPTADAKWQQEMGVAYFRQKDFGAAVKCFTQAAELGEAEAQCYLGFCFMYGQGVDKDEAKSLTWFLKAAAQGNVGAEYCLGGAYYLGRGVLQDFSAAVKWWRKAGEHGNADAQFNLAGCFEKGEGVMQNFVEAYKWAKRAAAQGNEVAQKKCDELILKMNPEQVKTVKALTDVAGAKR
jgi:tetratricopeptide (TPR) repeat protein